MYESSTHFFSPPPHIPLLAVKMVVVHLLDYGAGNVRSVR
jgi:hypothetical protein